MGVAAAFNKIIVIASTAKRIITFPVFEQRRCCVLRRLRERIEAEFIGAPLICNIEVEYLAATSKTSIQNRLRLSSTARICCSLTNAHFRRTSDHAEGIICRTHQNLVLMAEVVDY